jgi:hypothetical protein
MREDVRLGVEHFQMLKLADLDDEVAEMSCP